MALTERKIIDLIEVLETGHLQIREANLVERDGVVIARTFHRYVIAPGEDVNDKEQKIQDIAAVVWTTEVVAAYQATQQNNT